MKPGPGTHSLFFIVLSNTVLRLLCFLYRIDIEPLVVQATAVERPLTGQRTIHSAELLFSQVVNKLLLLLSFVVLLLLLLLFV